MLECPYNTSYTLWDNIHLCRSSWFAHWVVGVRNYANCVDMVDAWREDFLWRFASFAGFAALLSLTSTYQIAGGASGISIPKRLSQLLLINLWTDRVILCLQQLHHSIAHGLADVHVRVCIITVVTTTRSLPHAGESWSCRSP